MSFARTTVGGVALACLMLSAQDARPQVSPALRDAQALFQAQKWAEAVAAFEALVKTDPTDPRAKAGLGASLYGLGAFQRALPVVLDVDRMMTDPKMQFDYPGLPVGAVKLRAARLYNRLGQVDTAFEWLQQAARYPLPNPQSLEQEPDMANLRADARWKAFAETVRSNADPCGSRPEFRQLDFWVGQWDVLGAAGQIVGTSRIERTLNNCVLFETYTAAPGSSTSPNYVGQAFHFFDVNANKWVQHYIDTVAGPFDWTGELRGGALQYSREGPFGPSNVNVKQRMTFSPLPDGKVRQLFEQSIDGGKTWRTGFDGTYVKQSKNRPRSRRNS